MRRRLYKRLLLSSAVSFIAACGQPDSAPRSDLHVDKNMKEKEFTEDERKRFLSLYEKTRGARDEKIALRLSDVLFAPFSEDEKKLMDANFPDLSKANCNDNGCELKISGKALDLFLSRTTAKITVFLQNNLRFVYRLHQDAATKEDVLEICKVEGIQIKYASWWAAMSFDGANLHYPAGEPKEKVNAGVFDAGIGGSYPSEDCGF